MKYIIGILLIPLVNITGCSKPPNLLSKKSMYTIRIQPLDSFTTADLNFLANEIRGYFNKKVEISARVTFPQTYYDTVTNMYSADSILSFLLHRSENKKTVIVGLTHKSLFRINDNYKVPFYDTGILGYSYQGGNISVVTDSSISMNKRIPLLALRNNILHEFGHMMGLSHCSTPGCVMNKTNCGLDFCTACKRKLNE